MNGKRLAVLVALEKRVKEAAEDAKAEARYELEALYDKTGADRMAITVGDTKVGEVGMSHGKPKPVIQSPEKAFKWLDERDLIKWEPVKGWEKSVTIAGDKVLDKETGEVLEWAIVDRGANRVAIRGCKPEDVIEAHQLLGESINVQGLLGG